MTEESYAQEDPLLLRMTLLRVCAQQTRSHAFARSRIDCETKREAFEHVCR